MESCQAAVVQYMETQNAYCGVSLTTRFSAQILQPEQIINMCSDNCAKAEAAAVAQVSAHCNVESIYSLDGFNIPVSMVINSAGANARSPECLVPSSDGTKICLASILESITAQCADPSNPSVGRQCSAAEVSSLFCSNK